MKKKIINYFKFFNELICFDLVSSPSTPGAYLFSNPDERSKYEENLEEEKKSKQNGRYRFIADSKPTKLWGTRPNKFFVFLTIFFTF